MAEARARNGTTQLLTASTSFRSGKSRLATSKYEVYWLHRTYSGSVSTLQKSVSLSSSQRCVQLPSFLSFRIEPNNAVRWVTFLFCIRKVWASSLPVLRIIRLIHKIAKGDYKLRHVCPSVLPHGTSLPMGRIFMELYACFYKTVVKI